MLRLHFFRKLQGNSASRTMLIRPSSKSISLRIIPLYQQNLNRDNQVWKRTSLSQFYLQTSTLEDLP